MKVYLFADAHFGYETRQNPSLERVRAFLKLMDRVEEDGDRLCMVGDVFDFWFEYRTVIPKAYFPVLRRLAELSDRLPVDFITGNHDLWGIDFLESIGLSVHREPMDLEVAGRRFFLAHGDVLIDTDLGGRATRTLLGNRISTALYRLIHPDLGIPLAHSISRASRSRSEVQPPENLVPDPVYRILEQGYDGVILGHMHVPHLEDIDGKVFMYIGDWIRHFTYGLVDEVGVHLVHFRENREDVFRFRPKTNGGK
jgi:UDP-2,3-diacylglucosamine hydrolase